MTVYLLMTRGSSGDETEAQKHPQASRTSLSLLKSHSSDKKKTYFSKNLMTQSTTSTHTNRRSVRKKPYQRPAVRCCLARIIFILHLRCPRFHREKIAYTLVLHLTKKSQLIKAITSMYIMNNQEENIIFPLQS